MRARSFLVAATSAILVVSAVAAYADQTGMSDMHEQRRVGGKRCFTDHYHQGASAGERSRGRAMAAAITSWREFTAFEYGTDWANYAKAAGKQVSCSNSGGSWSCSLDALPCR